jgi:hypothetical protein
MVSAGDLIIGPSKPPRSAIHTFAMSKPMQASRAPHNASILKRFAASRNERC